MTIITDIHLTCIQYDHILVGAVGGTTSSFAIRSKAAVLLALVTKRQGGQLLQALLPELLRLAAEGPTQTEMVIVCSCITQHDASSRANNSTHGMCV